MAYSADVWRQLKNITADEFVRALERDKWKKDFGGKTSGTRAYIKEGSPRKRVVIHFHPGKTYGDKFLKGLLESIGWTEEDLRRLKLIR
ncbi:MAG: type II toxin-antitoxin system HicA family toxin [Thermomicrobiales bacterium]